MTLDIYDAVWCFCVVMLCGDVVWWCCYVTTHVVPEYFLIIWLFSIFIIFLTIYPCIWLFTHESYFVSHWVTHRVIVLVALWVKVKGHSWSLCLLTLHLQRSKVRQLLTAAIIDLDWIGTGFDPEHSKHDKTQPTWCNNGPVWCNNFF